MKKPIIILIAGIITAVTVTGCGQEREHTGPIEKVTLGVETSLLPAAVWVAEHEGYFEQEGLDLTDIPHIKPEVSKEPTILYVDDCTDAPERCQTRYRAYWTTFWCGGWWSIGWESHLRYTMAPFQPLQTRTSPLVTPHHLR